MKFPRATRILAVALFAMGPGLLWSATFNIADGDIAALRTAIITSGQNEESDTINLAPNGTYILPAIDTASSDGASGLPDIRLDFTPNGFNPDTFYNLTVNGNNSSIVRSSVNGIASFRLLSIKCAFSKGSSRVTINNITFANGIAGLGGGLYVLGDVTFNNCTIKNNNATTGAGLWTTYSVVMNNCTIMNNTAQQDGGGIFNNDSTESGNGLPYNGSLALTNCTFIGNYAQQGEGEGIYNKERFSTGSNLATVDLISCTFAGEGIYNDSTTSNSKITFANTLFASSTLENKINTNGSGSIVSRGYNLTDNANQGYFQQFSDRWNAHPDLDPAGAVNNGGPTPTVALCAGSDAIDHGNRFTLTTDQRGFPRPVDNASVGNTVDGTDIGAYEAPSDPMQSGFPFYAVTTLADHDDGLCSGNDCTLREAIARINAGALSSTISLATGLTGTLTLGGSELVATHSLSITGPGARLLAISANAQSRVLSVIGPISCALFGLTIRDGSVSGAAGSSNVGGGIYNEGYLTLTDCAVVDNRVFGGNAAAGSGSDGGMARGGAIFNGTSLTLNRCTIGGTSFNEATGGNGASHLNDGVNYIGGKGGAGLGGAIYNDVNGTVTIYNSTINFNTAAGGTGAAGTNTGAGGAGGQAVGGIFNAKTMTVTGSTIASNSGFGGAGGHGTFNNGAVGKGVGGIRAESGTSTIRSSIVARNTRNNSGGPDVDGTFVSSGFNLLGTNGGSSGFTNATDIAGTNTALLNPLLGPIQNNGGPTDTMALLTNSPAIDHGYAFNLTMDQRGDPRVGDDPVLGNASGGDGTDIGAYEAHFARITSLVRDANGVTVYFVGTLTKTFELERKFSLSDPSWAVNPFTTFSVLSTGGTMHLTDPEGANPGKIFYHVREL